MFYRIAGTGSIEASNIPWASVEEGADFTSLSRSASIDAVKAAAHSRISPTAKFVAYFRQYSNIPFAGEVARNLHLGVKLKCILKLIDLFTNQKQFLAPFLEARYKGILNAIYATGIHQVVEIGAGVSLRGLALTQRDPKFTYIETDLPGILEDKLAIVRQLTTQTPPNWHNAVVNALQFEDLQKAVSLLPSKSEVVIAHEGVLQYFSFSEKEALAKNIHRILSERGGAWITADLDTKESTSLSPLGKRSLRFLRYVVSKLTGRDLANNAFENPKERDAFFDRLGFKVESMPMVKGIEELSSVKKLQINFRSSDRFSNLEVWILRLK